MKIIYSQNITILWGEATEILLVFKEVTSSCIADDTLHFCLYPTDDRREEGMIDIISSNETRELCAVNLNPAERG